MQLWSFLVLRRADKEGSQGRLSFRTPTKGQALHHTLGMVTAGGKDNTIYGYHIKGCCSGPCPEPLIAVDASSGGKCSSTLPGCAQSHMVGQKQNQDFKSYYSCAKAQP